MEAFRSSKAKDVHMASVKCETKFRSRGLLVILTGLLLGLSQMDALSAPLNCSNVSKFIADAEIGYTEGDSYVKYQLSYDRGGYSWLGAAYEFRPPLTGNSLLAGADFGKIDELTTSIVDNYKELLVEAGVHTALEKSKRSRIKQGLVVTFGAVDKSLPFIYGFHVRRSGDNVQVFNVTGVATRSESSPSADETVEAVKEIIKSCQSHEA